MYFLHIYIYIFISYAPPAKTLIPFRQFQFQPAANEVQITQSQIALIKMLNKNGTHTEKSVGENSKTTFPCIFRFLFFCYNKLKHIFTLLWGFSHFSLFFLFSIFYFPFFFLFVGACKFSMWVYTDVRKSYCFKFCTFYWSSGWISYQASQKKWKIIKN